MIQTRNDIWLVGTGQLLMGNRTKTLFLGFLEQVFTSKTLGQEERGQQQPQQWVVDCNSCVSRQSEIPRVSIPPIPVLPALGQEMSTGVARLSHVAVVLVVKAVSSAS